MSNFKIKDNFEILVRGQAVRVEYDGISYGIVIHFSFYGNCISSTGYRSYFLSAEDFVSMKYRDYKICAQDIANKLYEDEKKERIKDDVIMGQLKLF